MEDLNRKTEEDRILELLRQLPRSKQAKLRALDSFLEDDMHTEVERQRIQYELDATPPEEDAIAIVWLLYLLSCPNLTICFLEYIQLGWLLERPTLRRACDISS
jgi:hypothetical protein